jgi:transposase-like protein
MNLRAVLDARKMGIAEAARKHGVTVSTIRRWIDEQRAEAKLKRARYETR